VNKDSICDQSATDRIRVSHTIALALLVFAAAGRADMPLLDALADARSIGPRTEPVDLAAYQRIVYVSSTAQAAADGSRQRPFASVQAAIDACKDATATSRCAVLVASGKYSPAAIQMREFVDLFGGFDDRWQRDIAANLTVLDAAGGGPVVRAANHARIDGFVITGGRNSGAGGGFLADHVSPVISNNIIRANTTVEPDDFRRDMIHQQGHDGGGIALLAECAAEVRNNLICQNTTGIGNGGGIFIWNDSRPKITANVIIDNHTGRAGQEGKEGSRSSNGGGIAVSYNCAPQITANLIAMNSVADNSDGGGIYLEYDAHAVIRGNWILGNFAADDGGGMYVMKNSQPLLERNVLAGNRNSSGGSGAIRLSKEGRLRAVNNLIVCNKTGMDAVHSWMILERNTFVDCITCAFVYENALQHMAPPIVSNNIFAGQMDVPAVLKPGPVSPRMEGNVVAGQASSQPDAASPAADLQFIDDQLIAPIARRFVDQANCLTVLTLRDVDARVQAGSLVGRVINVGQQWSVIREHRRSPAADGAVHELSVWGNLTDAAGECRVLGTYQLPPSSVYRDKGAYAISD